MLDPSIDEDALAALPSEALSTVRYWTQYLSKMNE